MTDHEAKAREIVKKQYGLFGFDLVLAPKQEAAAVKVVATALREAEAPLLKKIVELSSKVQRVEEINENLRAAVRDQPIKWNDEYYEMKLKEAKLAEREACAMVCESIDFLPPDDTDNPIFSMVVESSSRNTGAYLAAAIRSRNDE